MHTRHEDMLGAGLVEKKADKYPKQQSNPEKKKKKKAGSLHPNEDQDSTENASWKVFVHVQRPVILAQHGCSALQPLDKPTHTYELIVHCAVAVKFELDYA